MGRPLRIEYPGAFYHIISRGNERRPIFRSNRDYERFLGYFKSATERYGAQIHCFCLMRNHYHLLLETPRANLSAILHHINTGYTNYFNSSTGRVGHLFQGRYRAILVEKDSYALELSRYIHLNPARAHLVKEPSDYAWSSYLGYIGREKRWEWLETDFILGLVSQDRGEARKRYRRHIEEGIGAALRDPLEGVIGSTVLGSEGFVDWVRERWIGRREAHRDVPAIKKLSSGMDLVTIQKETQRMFGTETVMSRRVDLYLCHQLSGLSLVEIGKFFGGISPSAVSQNTRRLRALLETDNRLSERVEKLKQNLSQ